MPTKPLEAKPAKGPDGHVGKRPEWASGRLPKIAGPSNSPREAGRGKAGPGPGPRPVPGEPSPEPGLPGQLRRGSPRSARRMLGAATLTIAALLAGLLGGRLGSRGSPEPAESGSLPVQPPAQPAPALSGPDLAEIHREAAPSVVKVVPIQDKGPGTGASGVILDEQGTILTTNDALKNGQVKVILADGTEMGTVLAGVDEQRNLAALRMQFPPPGLPAAELGDSEQLAVGDPVAAIGAPFGRDQSLTAGVVSGLKRSFGGAEGTPPLRDLIQSDAPVNPGSFGGPLLDQEGKVVGINIAIESPVGAFVGVGYAVPINVAKQELLERIQEV